MRLSPHKYIIRFLSRKLLRNDKGGRTKFGSCNHPICHLDLKERSKDGVKNFLATLLLLLFLLTPFKTEARQAIKVGSKLFTESVILGEISSQLIESEGIEVEYYDQLGGTRILWNALQQGEIDIYPDYTGTIAQEILQETSVNSFEELQERLAAFNIKATQPLGFNNTYALGMRREQAEKLNIETISDLKKHPGLKHGYSNEFIDRSDGWRGVKSAYNLSPNSVIGLDHDLAYRGLESGSIDVIDLYSTDAEIEYYDIKVLADDRGFFPEYQAVFLYRNDVEERAPDVIRVLKQLSGSISESAMVSMNAKVKLEGMDSQVVASNFIRENFGVQTQVSSSGIWDRLWVNTLGHLYLVGISLGLAILIAIPTGILAVKVPAIEQAILGIVGILQTIPSLALLVFMIPLFGIGSLPAMAALFLYSLLPIVRNTHSGITNIPHRTMESAYALGLPNSVILKKIELPLAMPTILAGIKTSAVINVGTATLGALIGAGGYGQPILTGIRLDSVPLILEGAIPAAVLALLVQGFFDLIEKKLS